mmetsp:Transcript_16508/g.31276  ORF Transcript_16508/g.31276 Transcript_16508/m.31276 type:complete len:237 (+) Transcript_16508:125-835(+)
MSLVQLQLLLITVSLLVLTTSSWASFLPGFSSITADGKIRHSCSGCGKKDLGIISRSLESELKQKLRLQSSLSSSSSSTTAKTELEFDWQGIAKGVFENDDRPVILFDGICNLCNGGVNFALDHDTVGNFRFASLQSKVGQSLLIRAGKKPDDISSIVLVTPSEAYFKSDAVLRISAKLQGNPLLPFMGSVGPFVPRFVRNIVYDFVADNRYRFGEADQCRMDFDNEYGNRFVSDK